MTGALDDMHRDYVLRLQRSHLKLLDALEITLNILRKNYIDEAHFEEHLSSVFEIMDVAKEIAS